jgi:hypothetical protein
LEKVRQGVEVIVEQDHRAVAIIKTPQDRAAPSTNASQSPEARGSGATLDENSSRIYGINPRFKRRGRQNFSGILFCLEGYFSYIEWNKPD